MIFSAGLGTRFKPWTDTHPKALALVNGKPLLQRNIEYLQQFGIRNVVVNVHHFAGQVVESIKAHRGWGSNVQISDESDQLLETGGGLLKARPFLANAGRFVSVNVDILTNLNLHRLIEFHERENALISFGITKRKSSRNLLFDSSWRLAGWKNKATGEIRMAIPGLTGQESDLIPMSYSCVVVYEPQVFDLIRQRGKFSIMDTYLDLAATQRIMGFDHSGDDLVDVGRPESVAEAERLFA